LQAKLIKSNHKEFYEHNTNYTNIFFGSSQKLPCWCSMGFDLWAAPLSVYVAKAKTTNDASS